MWIYSGIVLFGMALVHVFYRWSGIANRRDLGWPADWKAWLLDIRIGLIAALAVIGPIYAIQIVVVLVFNMPTSHPLVEAFQQEPRLSVVLTICFSALVAAPIFEELLFRQLAQGWLERLNGNWNRAQSISETDEPPLRQLPMALTLLRCWWPICASSFLFALVHLGQGGAPIPLFFLALALGYLYQRTHRIVPCIVLHMLFNALAMALLGVQMALQ